MVLTKLRGFLDRERVPYTVSSHPPAFTAQEVAAAEHVPGQDLAKVVMVRAGGRFMMVVLPAPRKVDLLRLSRFLGTPEPPRLASEEEFAGLFPGCEPGAMPPFGNLFDLPVYVDRTLDRDEEIVFQAGSHTETMRMKREDFERLVQPVRGDFAAPTAEEIDVGRPHLPA
jgi:Ala-tRNA(Pro) deacylase